MSINIVTENIDSWFYKLPCERITHSQNRNYWNTHVEQVYLILYYDLVLINRRPQNHKNKNVEKKSLVHLANASSKMWPPATITAKIVIPQSSSFWEICPPPSRKGGKTLWNMNIITTKTAITNTTCNSSLQ